MVPDESNQWETYGDCSKCRKNNYCRKPCKKNKIAQQILIKRAVTNTMGSDDHILSFFITILT